MTSGQQNLLLDLLGAMGGDVGATDFQKLLFLYTKEYETAPSYDFVPYRFGCFSFTATAYRRRLIERGMLSGDKEGWLLTEAGLAHTTARQRSTGPMAGFVRRYGKMSGRPLVAEVYRRYPYYATRSTIVDSTLPLAAEREAVARACPPKRGAGLLTIGYEGRSLEGYLNTLLLQGVTLLCDVRANPLSRKYGFSKKTLSHACEGVGIRYAHVPELGIPSADRQELNEQADYDRLFGKYQREVLPLQKEFLRRIGWWVKVDGLAVALTCYERLPEQCHRRCVAVALEHEFGSLLAPHHL